MHLRPILRRARLVYTSLKTQGGNTTRDPQELLQSADPKKLGVEFPVCAVEE